MPNNVAASMTASIVIDKSDLLAQILKGLSEGQKELENNKLEMYFDFSDSKNKAEFEKTLQKYKKQLASDDFVVKITNQGIEETVKSLDKLLDAIKSISSGKGFGIGLGNGKGIGNSIVDENQLKTVIDLFTKMESNLSSIKKVFVDVGDGNEFSPLLSTIDKINSSISELSSNVKNIGFNMNIDVGSDTELEAKIQSKMSNALQAYQRLFEHIKLTGVGGAVVNTNFFEFDINQFDSMMAKIQAYRKFIENMRNQVKSEFGGKDLLYTETDKKYWTQAASAMGQLTKAQNEMSKAAEINPLDELFGKTDLSGVIEQLNAIVLKLDEISVASTKFSEVFSQGLNVTTSIEDITKLTDRVKELEIELSNLKSSAPSESNISSGNKDAFPDKDVSASVESATNSIKEENNVLEQNTQKIKENTQAKVQNANVNLNKYDSRLDSYNGKVDKYNATIARLKDGGWASDTYVKNVQAVEKAVKHYENLLNKIKTEQGGIASEEDIKTLKEYESEIKKTISTVTNMSASEKGYNFVSAQKELDKIHKLLAENSKMSAEAKLKIKAYYREIENGNPSMSLDKIHGEIMKIVNAEAEAGRAGKSMWDAIKEKAWYGIAGTLGTFISINDIFRYIGQGIDTLRELDSAMTEVRKVSEATETQYASFQKTVASTAKEIASTNKELLNSSADFLRLGYSIDQASDLAKNATLFVNVGDGVDITEATEDMITAMKAFDIQAEDSIKIVDSYNQIGNLYALSASDIGESMKRSASALETGNNTFEESIGLITAMNEIVQNSENTGNTLKVLSLRLRGAKAELESMSEDTDGLCDSSSKLREQLQALTGVDIMIDDSTFKSTADIIKELGATWDKLSDSSQAATLEIIAGKTRANNVAALLKNYQQIDNVIEDLNNAEGSALKENEAIIESINGRIKILSATLEEFWQTIIDKDVIKNVVTGAIDLLALLTQIVDKLGLIPTIATGLSVALSKKGFGKLLFQW